MRGGGAPRWTLAIACAALAATAAALSSSPAGRALAQALVADERVRSQPWRALTGPLVHATWGHLVRDVALVVIVGVAYERRLPARWGLVVAAGLALPAIAVIAAGARGYLGLSGFAYASIAAALAYELRTRTGAARVVVGAIAALLAVKVVYEALAPSASTLSLLPRSAWLALGPGVQQAPLAHLIGAAAGAIVVAWPGLSRSSSRRWRRSRSSPARPATPA